MLCFSLNFKLPSKFLSLAKLVNNYRMDNCLHLSYAFVTPDCLPFLTHHVTHKTVKCYINIIIFKKIMPSNFRREKLGF